MALLHPSVSSYPRINACCPDYVVGLPKQLSRLGESYTRFETV
jgi:hypothetical protein